MAIMSFLAGLPSEFESAKSQILSSFEIPFLQEVFSRVLHIESTQPVHFSGALVSQNNDNFGLSHFKNGNKGRSSNDSFETRTQEEELCVIIVISQDM